MKKVLRKLGSVKVWIALWSMWLITFIVVKDQTGFANLAILALTPIIGYLGANVWQDKIFQDKQPGAERPKDRGDAEC